MSRYGFDDIFARRGLLGSLYSPDMEGVTPQQGLLAGFDYRDPYKNESVSNEVLLRANTDFAAPTQPATLPWLAKSLANEQAASQSDKFYGFSRPTPADVEAAIGEPQTVQPQPIPRSYFESRPSTFERTGRYVGEADDAFWRAASNNIVADIVPDAGDRVAAAIGAATGVDGVLGDYQGNLSHQQINSALAKINSPKASTLGEAVGNALGGALMSRFPTIQGGIKDIIFKDRTPPPPPQRRIPYRGPR